MEKESLRAYEEAYEDRHLSLGMLTPWSNAIKINENTELLSRPTILVMDRERGYVTVGQNVPFLTATEVTDGGNMIQQIQLSCGVLSSL